ncbi:hypothetical protein PYW07_000323 [Mythimna separata]|uniref:Condensin complex subunit 1 C-terminal domain-containing protein n=1 Tax=Mythimna separata TaxID=271217 RepID=A0AAD8E1E7_MYTSE|nr:hypothetical protein PYW07_000323 [Mythimna separata]
MALVVKLNELQLDRLDHGWVTAIYRTEFLEFCDLPEEYERAIDSVDLNTTFKAIIESADSWLSSEDIPNEEKSWAYLSSIIQQKKVLAILAYYIDYGRKNVHTREYRNYALLASRVYFKLLLIPGFKVYHIYHSQLFAQSLTCLHFPIKMCDGASNFNSRELTKEVNYVLKQLLEFAADLKVIVEHLKLSPTDLNFEDFLSNLVEITGYAIVDKLHKCVGPYYVTYSILLLATHGKPALNGYMCLLEHFCLSQDGLERAEVRDLRSKLVVDLMISLPLASYREYLTWLIDLSAATRLCHRQLATEALAKLLGNGHEEHEQPAEQAPGTTETGAPSASSSVQAEPPGNDQTPNEQASGSAQSDDDMLGEDAASLLSARNQKEIEEDILRGVFDRTEDESATLRTRALVILTKCLASKHAPLINTIKQLNGDGGESRLMAVIARRTNDERAVVRKAAATLQQQLLAERDAPPPQEQHLKRRAAASRTAPESEYSASCYSDERAAVRNAAATLLQQLLADRDAPPPQEQHLAILVGQCRDASIIVRTAAITALGELLIERPSETVLNAFLNGPLHQISDPETKVQEQVLSLIQRLLIDRLRQFTGPESDDPMPWMFLAGIIRRQKKQYLHKVCLMLSRSTKCINPRLVDILSSHLGALNDERDQQCLLLLTSVAPHVQYSDLAFVLNYYYTLTDNEQIDAKLLGLAVDLLSSWARFLHAPERTRLRDHLVQRLAAGTQTTCRIKCGELAAALDPDNLTWATELMQSSERRAVSSGDVEEALRATDLSLLSPVPPGPGLLRVFLKIADAPEDWDNARSATAVAGMARLCIRSRDAALTCAPIFAALLARHYEVLAVRVNSLVGLSDICHRYTGIVEPLLGSMCACLDADAPVLLRRMATRQITRLLVGEYLRLRTPLYFRYCALLADEDVEVREPAEYYVSTGLTVDTIYHHFVESVLYYNQDQDELELSFDKRQQIYDVMLQRMSLAQRLNVQCRLARDVLDAAADAADDGDEELPPATSAALLDAITILAGPWMKLPKKPQKPGEVNDIDDLQERVTTNIVSHKMKVQVVEVLVPAVMRLYARLRPRGGQLNTRLVQLASELLKDYEPEIKEIFEDNVELMDSIQKFQNTIGVTVTFGNVRNPVTRSAPAEPETPRARRVRAPPPARRRALRA